MAVDLNPYDPPLGGDAATDRVGISHILVAVVLGFSAGTATHWILFWTDTVSSDFPPAGGALLGCVVSLWLMTKRFKKPLWVVAPCFLLGSYLAYDCRHPKLRYINPFNDVPRDYFSAWTSATVSFVLAAFVVFALTAAIGRAMAWLRSYSEQSK